jgi:Fic family protein
MMDEQGNIITTLFNSTPAFLVPKEMQELITWTEENLKVRKFNSLLIVTNFVVEFLNIHPFQDDNGRLSRVSTNLLLLKEGYIYTPYASQKKLIEDSKSEYYIALRKTQKTIKGKNEDLTPWLDYFFNILDQQSILAINLLNKQDVEKLLSVKQLLVWNYLKLLMKPRLRKLVGKQKLPVRL